MFSSHEKCASQFFGISDRHLHAARWRSTRLAPRRARRAPGRVRVRVRERRLTVAARRRRRRGERVGRERRRTRAATAGRVPAVLPVSLERLFQRLPGRAHRRRRRGGPDDGTRRPAPVVGVRRPAVPRRLAVVVGASGRREDVLEADMGDLQRSRIVFEQTTPRRFIVRPTARRRTLPRGRQAAAQRLLDQSVVGCLVRAGHLFRGRRPRRQRPLAGGAEVRGGEDGQPRAGSAERRVERDGWTAVVDGRRRTGSRVREACDVAVVAGVAFLAQRRRLECVAVDRRPRCRQSWKRAEQRGRRAGRDAVGAARKVAIVARIALLPTRRRLQRILVGRRLLRRQVVVDCAAG